MPITFRVFAALCLLAGARLSGQGTTSRAVGTVQDPSGAVVANAAVSLTNQGTGATFSTTTSAAGTYVFEAIQSGSYTVAVETAGFRKFVSRDNAVTIGQPMTVNVRLEVGAVAESVEVAASYQEIQTSTSGNFGNLLSERLIRDWPLITGARGRNVLTLLVLQPGVVSGSNAGGGTHVHGARDRAWNFTLDGVDINETSASGSNFSPLRTNPDSLAEFRVITSNFTAEYGRNSGGQVALITRSGTNEYHGTGFWFYRTPRLNANEWENNINAVGKRQYVQHISGGSVGGPILRDRTFFFTNVQLLKTLQTGLVSRTVYTEPARRGLFRYVRGGRNGAAGGPNASVDLNGNVLPGLNVGEYNIALNDPQRLGLDRTVAALIARTPSPNSFTGGDGLNTALFQFTDAEKEKQRDFVFKIDHIFNPQNTLYARIAWGRQDTECDTANTGQRFFPDTPCRVNTQRHPRNLAFNWRWNPTPRLTNELVIGHNQFLFDFLIPTNDLNKVTLEAPVTLPEAFYFGNQRFLRTLQFVDNLAYFRGAHSLKFGANIRYQRHTDIRGSIAGQNAGEILNFSTGVNTVDPATFGIPADINVTFDRPVFQTHINFLLGRVGSISRGFIAEGDRFVPSLYDFAARFPEHDFYVQDTWKLRKNLTVDLGLRWEIKLAPTDPLNRIKHPDQPMTAGSPPSNTIRWVDGPLYDDDWNSLSPSVGLAWDPTGRGKTSIRTNYRLAYDRVQTFVLSSAVFQNLPGLTQGVVYQDYGQAGGRLPNAPHVPAPAVKPSELTQPPAFSANSINVVDPALRSPVTHQWALGVQHEIAGRTVIEATYIGRRAYGLLGAHRPNQAEIFRNGFLEAFNVVKAGGNSDLMNRILVADSRRLTNETGSQMVRRLFAGTLDLNSVGALASALGTRIQSGRSVTDLSGVGPFLFIPFPQFSGGVVVIDSNDFSTYHALELQFQRRLSRGIAYRASYTLAKSLDTRSFDPTFDLANTGNAQSATSTPFDLSNRKLNYARSDFDRTHVLQSDWLWELPFGKSRTRWTDKVTGGWQIIGVLRLQTGRPLTVYSGSNTVSSNVQTPANCGGCRKTDGRVFDDAASGLKWYLNPAERAQFSTPGPGQWGDTGRNFLNGPGFFNLDLGVIKRIYWKERWNVELRADTTNLTNSPSFGFPTATITSTLFGRIRDSVASGSRKIQLGAKINF